MASPGCGASHEAVDPDVMPTEEHQQCCEHEAHDKKSTDPAPYPRATGPTRLTRILPLQNDDRGHTDDKHRACTACYRLSTRAHDRRSHDPRYTEARRFICSWRSRTGHVNGCQKTFSREANFKRHLLNDKNRGCLKSVSANFGPFQSMEEAADHFVKIMHPLTVSVRNSPEIYARRSPHGSPRRASRCLTPVQRITINTKCATYGNNPVVDRHAAEVLTPDSLQSMDEDLEAFFRIESLKRALNRKGIIVDLEISQLLERGDHEYRNEREQFKRSYEQMIGRLL